MKKRIAAVCATSAIAVAGSAGPAAASHGERDPFPPHCEHGQMRAAENAKSPEQFAKHTAKGLACLAGEDPGQGGG